MWWLTGETGARDVVLHYVDAIREHVEVSRRRRPLRQEPRGDLSNLIAKRCRQLFEHAIEEVARDTRGQGRLCTGLACKASSQEITIEINSDNHFSPESSADRDRDWIGQTAIDKPFTADLCRTENSGQRNRSTHRLINWSRLQPNLSASSQIGSDCCISLGVARLAFLRPYLSETRPPVSR